MNETLDSVFDASDDEAEQDAIVTQVLDEIGIDMSSKVSMVNLCEKCYKIVTVT